MKNYLKSSIVYFCLGIVFLILAYVFPDISIFVGFAGACIGPAIMMVLKYLYWRKRPIKYSEKIEDESIELHDERKEMIRGKSLRISTLINWCILSAFISIVAFLGQLQVISIETSKPIIITIAAYWFISVVIMQIVYKYLSKKY
ncbi:MAG: hypothetical protein ACRC7V_07305 [Lachnospiraceae bacterium]